MAMVELPKAHQGGSFWLNSERIVSMEVSESYSRYTNIRTDDGQLHATSLEPKRVAALIQEGESQA